MAFTSSTQSKNKNQVVLSMVSKKTGKAVSWSNLVDSFARSVFGCEVHEVTKEMLLEKNIPAMYETPFLEMHITDTTAEPVQINPEEY